MAYKVFENGVACGYLVSTGRVDKSWGDGVFTDKKSAEVYALMWAKGFPKSLAEKYRQPMDVGVEYDFSFCEIPVWMSIQEVE